MTVIWAEKVIDYHQLRHSGKDNIQYIILLFIEHVFSFAASNFRYWEIKTNGRPDVNGVMRAPIETFLMTVE